MDTKTRDKVFEKVCYYEVCSKNALFLWQSGVVKNNEQCFFVFQKSKSSIAWRMLSSIGDSILGPTSCDGPI